MASSSSSSSFPSCFFFGFLHSTLVHTSEIIKHLCHFSIFSYGIQLPSKMTYKWLYILLFFCHLNCLFTFTLQCWYTAFSLRQHYIKLFSIHYAVYYLIPNCIKLMWGTWWHSWLRHCATSWKIAGSILDGINVIFHWFHHSGCTMVLGSTQPLADRVNAASEYGCQPYYLPVPTALKFGSLSLLQPSGPFQSCTVTTLSFYHFKLIIKLT